jgi:diaminopimelate decarboxylase
MTASLSASAQPVGYPYFHYLDGVLHAEGVSLQMLAYHLGTPLYVYSRAALHAAWESYREAITGRDVLVCYGMKANSNLAVLKEFVQLGAGFDIVSGGELHRVLAVGADPAKIVFSGVGKQAWEMHKALEADVKCFNVESEAELHLLSDVAVSIGKKARVSLRVNPDVDAGAHPYISTGLKENKFGISITDAPYIYQTATSLPGLIVTGVDCHIGSQITEVSPYLDALNKLLNLIEALHAGGIDIEHLDLGGGLGIRYIDEMPLRPATLIEQVYERLNAHGLAHLKLIIEPGRSLIGNAGVLLTTVQFLKHTEARNFAIVDAAMNDLLRPTLYNAWHGVLPIRPRSGATQEYDVVGPVCESGDWLAKQRALAVERGDVLAIESTGAYGMVMAGNYNTRPRPAEVMVDGTEFHIIRQRETVEDLLRGESTLS